MVATISTTKRFDPTLYNAALNYYGLPANYNRAFTEPGCIPCNPASAAPVWVQINLPKNNFPLQKASNKDIATLLNVTLDFEYPADPLSLRVVSADLVSRLVFLGLAEPGLAIEDSGAGNHIVIPIVPIDVTAAGGGELVNLAVARIVKEQIEPEFEKLLEREGLSGQLPNNIGKDGKPKPIKLEAFDISRILSVPGTWRLGGSKPNEMGFLANGYLRRWLYPFDQVAPIRKESRALSELIKATCISIMEDDTKAHARKEPGRPAAHGGDYSQDPAEWLRNYIGRKALTGDRSEDFHAVVTGCYLKYGDETTVLSLARLIDELTGAKYGKRAEREAKRSLENPPPRENRPAGAGSSRTTATPAKVNRQTGEIIQPAKPEYVRPRLNAMEGDLHLLNPLVWEALEKYNQPARLFKYGGRLQRFESEGEKWSLHELNESTMRFEIIEAIEWFKSREAKGESIETPTVPPRHVAQNLLADPYPKLPALLKVVETPVFTSTGELITTPGFHPSGILFNQPQGAKILPVSNKPTSEDIAKAKSFIDELLCDFPFTNNGERTNAISIFFDPYLREMVKGATPLRLIEASTPGSGKGLLADVLTRHATGQPGLITQCHTEEEWNKSLISQLKGSASVIIIDNISTVLDSGALAAVLTSEYYGGRLLGTNETVQWPNRAIWLATANNPTMTTEIARRTIRIRLDPKQDRPWQREDFKHSDLRAWADDHRPDLTWAALTLIQDWIVKGKPLGSNKPLGSFEHWSRTLGGVLENAGFKDFLSNLDEFYEVADLEGAVLRNFVHLWWSQFEDKRISTSDLFSLTTDFEGFDLGKGGDRSQRMVFGKLLARQRDRVIGDFIIKGAGIKNGVTTWKLSRGGQIGF